MVFNHFTDLAYWKRYGPMFQPSLTGCMCPALHPGWFLVMSTLTSNRHSPPVWPEISVHSKHVQCIFWNLIASSSCHRARRYLLGHALIKMTSTGGAAERFLRSTDLRGPPALHNKESFKSEFWRHNHWYKKGKICTCQQLLSLLWKHLTTRPTFHTNPSKELLTNCPVDTAAAPLQQCCATLAMRRDMVSLADAWLHDSMQAGHDECV
jgi:hypothetical protein